jgi:tripartite-type tricarboxylate transporter receptor subunit TctC
MLKQARLFWRARAAFATAAQAQTYPARDITFIVPWNAAARTTSRLAPWIRSCASTASRS